MLFNADAEVLQFSHPHLNSPTTRRAHRRRVGRGNAESLAPHGGSVGLPPSHGGGLCKGAQVQGHASTVTTRAFKMSPSTSTPRIQALPFA